jgi:hypothetical protein
VLSASQQNTTLAVNLISSQEYAYYKEILITGLTTLDISIVDAIALQRVSGLCIDCFMVLGSHVASKVVVTSVARTDLRYI